MVEIRVAVDEDTGVHGLMRRLAALFGRSAISFDRSRNEVRVESEWESRAVVGVLDAVEAWIDNVAPVQPGARFELVIPLRAPERDKAHRSR